MEYLLTQNKPILGICRGMQILNIALGGTIYQDLSLRPDLTFSHMQSSLNRSDLFHRVSFSNDSQLFHTFQNFEFTNSFHHQAIHRLGKNLMIAGTSDDGVIEAIESPVHSFVIGVQWHPECLFDLSKATQNLFRNFIKKCQ